VRKRFGERSWGSCSEIWSVQHQRSLSNSIEGLLIHRLCRVVLINRPFESAFAQHTYLFRKGTFLSVKLFGTLAFFWRRMKPQTAQSQQLTA
jgi:hypothetical protein